MHKDMRMTSVSWPWENSLTRYQGSFSGPLVQSKYGVPISACQLILTKLGSLLSREGNLQVSCTSAIRKDVTTLHVGQVFE